MGWSFGIGPLQFGSTDNLKVSRNQTQSAERIANQNRQHQRQQNELQRGWQTGEREGAQQHRTSERLGTQGWQTGERESTQGWQSGESALGREHEAAMQQGRFGHEGSMQSRLLSHYASQSGLDRSHDLALQQGQFENQSALQQVLLGHQASEGALGREHELALQDARYGGERGLLDAQFQNDLEMLGARQRYGRRESDHILGLLRDPSTQALLKNLSGYSSSTGSGDGTAPDGSVIIPGYEEDLSGQQAEFTAAAGRQADLAQGAERAVRQDLQSRGFGEAGGGALEAELLGDVRGGSQQALSDLIAQQATQASQRRFDVGDRNLQAALTQRGQNIQQDFNRASARQGGVGSLLSAILGSRGLY